MRASDWYDPASYPELRSAPPWVMEDMIQAQVTLPEMLTEALAGSAPRLVDMLRSAAVAGELEGGGEPDHPGSDHDQI